MEISHEEIKKIIKNIYEELLENDEGNVADYIPQLGTVNPDLFGISFCNVNGKTFSIGNTDDEFCLQSCSKPLSYCIARELSSLEHVHSHVGYEPSGQAFNAFVLNRDSLPHNPMINAGAMMICSLIEPDKEPSKRFETIKKFYKKLCGNQGKVGFDNSVYLSEQHHADRNMSLAYYMRESGAFDSNIGPSEIQNNLNLYFQCCSSTINCNMGAIMAATLANGGVCPIGGEYVFSKDIVKDCLSLMYMCGMYDYSGQFAFEIGMPAKSGVSGCLFLVIPNKFGICIRSPRLDVMGNTVRGVEFCRKFNKMTNYRHHIFNTITCKDYDLSNKSVAREILINACANGDLEKVKELSKSVDLNEPDYDKRTALHLAAEEGNVDIVNYLVSTGIDINPVDRWGNTPLSSVKLIIKNKDNLDNLDNYKKIIKILEQK